MCLCKRRYYTLTVESTFNIHPFVLLNILLVLLPSEPITRVYSNTVMNNTNKMVSYMRSYWRQIEYLKIYMVNIQDKQ